MSRSIIEKTALLRDLLEQCGQAVIAFSGGTDSSLLLAFAAKTRCAVTAVTAAHCAVPEAALRDAADLCRALGVPHRVLRPDPLGIPQFRENAPDRCYHCKRAIFGEILAFAEKAGAAVLDGTNADDSAQDRPGMRALAELGVRSPLREAGLTKAEIRALAKEMGLRVWNLPASACLATRIPFGETVTEEKLRLIGRAESILHAQGFSHIRVRLHGGCLARIETDTAEIAHLLEKRQTVSEALRALGIAYITLDLEGYRSGGVPTASI